MKTTMSIVGLCALAALWLTAPMAAQPERGLGAGQIETLEKKFSEEGDHSALINAVTNNDIKSLSLNRRKLIDHNKLFNLKLKSTGVTDQQSSGRCWLFSGLSIFSPEVMKKLKVSDFELSEPYLTFWDKLEKANLFLEAMIELRAKPVDDRTVVQLLEDPCADGGWWRYVTDLLEKYGAVPLSAMPETKQSIRTGQVNDLLAGLLRGDASELRQMHLKGVGEEKLRGRKEQMLYDVYKTLVFNYGQPPKEFKFRYAGSDTTVSDEKTYTPKSFFETFINPDLPRYAELMDDPTKAYDKMYEYDYGRNMADKPNTAMLNLPISKIKAYCLRQLRDSLAVCFACDVGKENFRDSAIFRTDIYDYNTTFGIDFKVSRADRILYRDTSPNHSMVFIGVDTADNGSTVKWLVRNSWGQSAGDKGLWYMYDDWFDQYVYSAVIDKRFIDAGDLKKLEQKPVLVPTWDPFWAAMRGSR
jgi:bleomycin hydrolase